MATQISDLVDLEIAFLGVLSLGLPPARAARDDTFRVDHCVAVVQGLRERGDPGLHLDGTGPLPVPAFGRALAEAVRSLVARGILAEQPSGMPAAPGGFEAGLEIDLVNPDLQPAVMDRWLAQECLDHLLGIEAVYPFLMGQYARAGEFWRAARADGYGR